MSAPPKEPPADHRNAVYAMFVALGMGTLLPYNSFIAAPAFMTHYYRYAADDASLQPRYPAIWGDMETLVVVLSMVPNFLCQCLLVTQRGQRCMTLHTRTAGGAVVLAIAVLTVALLPAIGVGETFALVALFAVVTMAGAATAFFQSSVFAMAAMLPAKYTQAAMLGIGASGVTTSALQMITKAAMHGSFEQQRAQAMLFLGLGAAWAVLCVGLSFVLRRNAYARHHIAEFVGGKGRDENDLL
jgi:equilibrative nucleoside transporter 1/2/3